MTYISIQFLDKDAAAVRFSSLVRSLNVYIFEKMQQKQTGGLRTMDDIRVAGAWSSAIGDDVNIKNRYSLPTRIYLFLRYSKRQINGLLPTD